MHIHVVSKMSVVLSMFNHHSKLLARSYTTPALLFSSTGSILLSCLLPSHLFSMSLTICAFLKQANCNQCFGYHLMTSKCVHQSRSADLCIQMLTRPLDICVISHSKCPRPKCYSSPFSKLFLWNVSPGRWHHHSLIHPVWVQEPLSVSPSFSSSSKPKWSQSFSDLCLLKCFSNYPPSIFKSPQEPKHPSSLSWIISIASWLISQPLVSFLSSLQCIQFPIIHSPV